MNGGARMVSVTVKTDGVGRVVFIAERGNVEVCIPQPGYSLPVVSIINDSLESFNSDDQAPSVNSNHKPAASFLQEVPSPRVHAQQTT